MLLFAQPRKEWQMMNIKLQSLCGGKINISPLLIIEHNHYIFWYILWLLSTITPSPCCSRILSTFYAIPSNGGGDWIIPKKMLQNPNEQFQKIEKYVHLKILRKKRDFISYLPSPKKAPVFSFNIQRSMKWLGFFW